VGFASPCRRRLDGPAAFPARGFRFWSPHAPPQSRPVGFVGDRRWDCPRRFRWCSPWDYPRGFRGRSPWDYPRGFRGRSPWRSPMDPDHVAWSRRSIAASSLRPLVCLFSRKRLAGAWDRAVELVSGAPAFDPELRDAELQRAGHKSTATPRGLPRRCLVTYDDTIGLGQNLNAVITHCSSVAAALPTSTSRVHRRRDLVLREAVGFVGDRRRITPVGFVGDRRGIPSVDLVGDRRGVPPMDPDRRRVVSPIARGEQSSSSGLFVCFQRKERRHMGSRCRACERRAGL
jgi:hypothetical protein